MGDWGFGVDLDKNVFVRKTKERRAFDLIRYTTKEISKIWTEECTQAIQRQNIAQALNLHVLGIEQCFIEYLDNKCNLERLKAKLEGLYGFAKNLREGVYK